MVYRSIAAEQSKGWLHGHTLILLVVFRMCSTAPVLGMPPLPSSVYSSGRVVRYMWFCNSMCSSPARYVPASRKQLKEVERSTYSRQTPLILRFLYLDSPGPSSQAAEMITIAGTFCTGDQYSILLRNGKHKYHGGAEIKWGRLSCVSEREPHLPRLRPEALEVS